MQDNLNTINKLENTFIKNLGWRYAVKKFDIEKKVNANDLQLIKDAIRMTPTSYGLQPYRVMIVENNQALKDKLKSSSYNQSQVSTCSHLFIFVANSDVQKRIGEYCDLSEHKSKGLFQRAGIEAIMRGSFAMRSEEAKLRWATNQAYIALGFAMAACAELKVDSCAMEGFNSDDYKGILELKENEYAAVLLPVGYRVEEPSYAKTRFDEADMFEMR